MPATMGRSVSPPVYKRNGLGSVRIGEDELNTLRRKYSKFTNQSEKFIYGVKVEQSIASLHMPSLASQPSTTFDVGLDTVDSLQPDYIDEQKVQLMQLKVKKGDVGTIKLMPKFMQKYEKQQRNPRPSTAPALPASTPTYTMSSKELKAFRKAKSTENRSQVEVMLEDFKKQSSEKLRGLSCYEPAVGKGRCGLCEMYFTKVSLKGVISMKSILDLRRSWGLKQDNKRLNSASFIYKKCSLCSFCSQMFDRNNIDQRKYSTRFMEKDDKEAGVKVVIANQIKLDSLIASQQNETEMVRNLAVIGTASQSSTVDGKLATRAISGQIVFGSNSNNNSNPADGSGSGSGSGSLAKDLCSMTRREYESWWEVDLGSVFPIKQITVHHRKDSGGSGGGAAHKLSPFWLFVGSLPFGSKQLSESKRSCSVACRVSDHEGGGKTVWRLPRNTGGSCVRIQVEGIKSLQIFQVEILKGVFVGMGEEGEEGEQLRHQHQPETPNSPRNSKSIELFTKQRLNQASATEAPSARPSTAPQPSSKSFVSSFRSGMTSPINPNGGGQNSRPKTAQNANAGARKKKDSFKSSVTSDVLRLFASTSSSYSSKSSSDLLTSRVLSRLTSSEVEGLQRCFLNFAHDYQQGYGNGIVNVIVPSGSYRTLSPSAKVAFQELLDRTFLSRGEAGEAMRALQEGGATAPRYQKVKYFGLWDKDGVGVGEGGGGADDDRGGEGGGLRASGFKGASPGGEKGRGGGRRVRRRHGGEG